MGDGVAVASAVMVASAVVVAIGVVVASAVVVAVTVPPGVTVSLGAGLPVGIAEHEHALRLAGLTSRTPGGEEARVGCCEDARTSPGRSQAAASASPARMMNN